MTNGVVYGLDIETGHVAAATPGDAGDLDPRRSPVTRAVLSTPAHDLVFAGDEADLLDDLDEVLEQLEPGILATWNGSGFALPYLADRAALCGVRLGLRLAADPRLRPRGETLTGHRSLYRAAWYDHGHLDAARLYRSGRRPLIEVTELLRAFGWHSGPRPCDGSGPADVPGGELTHAATHAFAANDARLVRSMVETRLPGVARHIDRVLVAPRATGTPRASAVQVLRARMDEARPPMSPAHPAVRASLLRDLALPDA